MNDRCLYCGGLLSDMYENGWHKSCVREFFQLESFPKIEITKQSLLPDIVDQTVGIPGVQRKLSLGLEKENSGTYRFTLVGKPQGYILKPEADDYDQLPENEYSTMCLARIFGLSTVQFGLIKLTDDSKAYISKRMDRKWKGPTVVGKIAMEDFCQLSEAMTEEKYRSSYEKCARIIRAYSVQPGLDLSEFFMRLVFSFIVGNSDMHLKNFSLLEQSWGWTLSPAYDLLNTSLVIPQDDEEMALTINGKKRRLKRSDFEIFGTRIGVPMQTVKRVLDLVEGQMPLMLEQLEYSLLSPEMKDGYRAIMLGRAERLVG